MNICFEKDGGIICSYDIMSTKEKQATPKAAFIFLLQFTRTVWGQISCSHENLLTKRYEGSHFMSKNELRSSGERRSAVHDNRMLAKRAFYCIANGAGEQ